MHQEHLELVHTAVRARSLEHVLVSLHERLRSEGFARWRAMRADCWWWGEVANLRCRVAALEYELMESRRARSRLVCSRC